MKTRTSIIAVVVPLIILGVIGIFVFRWLSGVPVRVTKAAKGPIQEFVEERGTTRLPRTYLITMPYAGRIAEILAEEGMSVDEGQVVAHVVPIDLELDVEESRAVVDRLGASIQQNQYQSIEQTALQQAKQFVLSMRSTVQAAATRVESGRAKVDYSEKKLSRTRELHSTGAETQDDLDQAVLEAVQSSVDFQQDQLVHAAMQSLEAATNLLPTMILQFIERKGLTGEVLRKEQAEAVARLRAVEQARQRGTMVSPVSGLVLNRWITNERFLTAGEPLLEIGRLEDLQVEADLLSLDVVDIRPGNWVEIHGPTIGSPAARGQVQRIYPAGFTKISSLGVEQQRVKVVIDLMPEDLTALRARKGVGVGYRVRVKIVTAEKKDALVIPRSGLFRGTDGTWKVYAVRRGLARLVTVKVGMLNDRLAEITEGLEPGTSIIVEPESALIDGQRVKAR